MTTTTSTVTLKTAIGPHGHFAALKNGGVKPERITFNHIEVDPIRNAFRRMCRQQEFDVSEMAIVTYLLAHEWGRPFTAIPVFPARNMWHGAFAYHVNSGIKEPKDLEGKTGAIRAYTQTSGVWARGILATEYGVNLDKVNWVHNDEEHVEEFYSVQPPNIKYEIGADFLKLLAEGKISFGMGLGGERGTPTPDLKPLIPNPRDAADEWSRRTGLYPIDHMVVLKKAWVEQYPWLPQALMEAFVEAKRQWAATDPNANTLAGSTIQSDRYPYGVAANRSTIETMIKMARDQHVLTKPVTVEDLFDKSVLNT